MTTQEPYIFRRSGNNTYIFETESDSTIVAANVSILLMVCRCVGNKESAMGLPVLSAAGCAKMVLAKNSRDKKNKRNRFNRKI